MEIIDPKELVSAIDSRFWRHITREAVILDVIKFADIKKTEFLLELGNRVRSGNYHPTTSWIIGFPKVEGIIRPVMAISLSDSIIYYYCLKRIQDKLVARTSEVEHVYGGFRITEKLQLDPSQLDSLAYDPNYEGFASFNYRKAWSEYQNLAKRLADARFDYYLHLDIAHFYDAIRIDMLEREVRNVASDSGPAIDLLFYFLKNLRPSYQANYSDNSVGLPQEEVGEMSRLLANFYLSSFDRSVISPLARLFKGKRGVAFQYTRYADDIWIAFNGEKNLARRASQIVGQLLSDLGLHLNDAKSKIMTGNEYNKHWCFSEWERIHELRNNPKELLKKLKQIYERKEQLGRWFTPFSYGLKVLASKRFKDNLPSKRSSEWLIGILLNEAQLMSRRNQAISTFYVNILKDYPALTFSIIDYLMKNPLYPLVSYVLWDIVLSVASVDTGIKLTREIYTRKTWRVLWWYERIIALKYFSSHGTKLLGDNKQLLSDVLDRIGENAETMNELERRASIRFLSSLPDQKGIRILRSKFGQPRDLTLMNYLGRFP